MIAIGAASLLRFGFSEPMINAAQPEQSDILVEHASVEEPNLQRCETMNMDVTCAKMNDVRFTEPARL
jgi:hypothetical protein